MVSGTASRGACPPLPSAAPLPVGGLPAPALRPSGLPAGWLEMPEVWGVSAMFSSSTVYFPASMFFPEVCVAGTAVRASLWVDWLFPGRTQEWCRSNENAGTGNGPWCPGPVCAGSSAGPALAAGLALPCPPSPASAAWGPRTDHGLLLLDLPPLAGWFPHG